MIFVAIVKNNLLGYKNRLRVVCQRSVKLTRLLFNRARGEVKGPYFFFFLSKSSRQICIVELLTYQPSRIPPYMIYGKNRLILKRKDF